MNKQITIGADPEVFFKKQGVIVPAIGLVGGTKQEPRPCGIGSVQEDNVMAEFNIPPAINAEQFSNRIEAMLRELGNIARSHKCDLEFTACAMFHPNDLLHPQARVVGCEPDYNAWSGEINPVLDAEQLMFTRTASGHVHIGVPEPNKSPLYRVDLVRACDLYLGVPSILFEPEEDNMRRNFYGKAGAFRPKPYGVEYRVLGNWWLTKDRYRRWVFDQAIKAVENYNRVSHWLREGMFNQDYIYQAINNANKKLAKELCNRFDIGIPSTK